MARLHYKTVHAETQATAAPMDWENVELKPLTKKQKRTIKKLIKKGKWF